MEGFQSLELSEWVLCSNICRETLLLNTIRQIQLTKKLFCLAQRRHALEEWMERLLADIDISRSVPLASFLELEAAVRAGMFRCRAIMRIIDQIVYRILFLKKSAGSGPVSSWW